MRATHIVGGILNFLGGAMGRAAGTGLVIGLFMVAFGMTPAQFTAQTILNPPDWMENSIFKLGILIVGLVVI